MDRLQVLDYPVHVTFHGVERDDQLEESIRSYVAHLPRFHPRIHGVDVTVTSTRSHRTGNQWRVKIRVSIPGRDVVGGDHHSRAREHENPFYALSDAFRAVERQLADDNRMRKGFIKSRSEESLQQALVARLDDDHGFLETPDGRDIYFHRHSVLDDRFDDLLIGGVVRFAEEQGEQGPQASTVHMGSGR
jgi:cold shock CspA family protein/ribosome-associated translation inhibitor RaiA